MRRNAGNRWTSKAWGFALGWVSVAAFMAAGCSDEDSEAPYTPRDTIAPTVDTVAPPRNANNVKLQDPVMVLFSEAMDKATLNANTVAVGARAQKFSGGSPASPQSHVPLQYFPSLNGDSLIALPDSLFPPEQELVLTIAGATDLAGNQVEPYTTTFTTGPFDCEHLADRMEPNDEVNLGTDLALDSAYTSLSTCSGDVDFYEITLRDTFKLTARTEIVHADRDLWEIAWARSDSVYYATLLTTIQTGDDASFHRTFTPGLYYLQVHGPDSEEMILYDLTVESSDPCPDDDYEENDFQEDAYELEQDGILAGLTGCYLDADWFMIEVMEGTDITLEVDTGAFLGMRELQIIEPGGGEAADSWEGVSSSQIGLTATEDGTAYIMTMMYADDVEYSLGIALNE
ncbi:MAG: hypothetical protein GF355_10925 [Candidatus Eisenbacteria bacterium]|nr:hypothetical protein [Candidatus Eisenbacteria bacterium]